MSNDNELSRITELTKRIEALPKGYVSKKTISGKTYYYHQWSQGGKKQSRYLHDGEIEPLARQIEQRKALQAELRELRSKAAGSLPGAQLKEETNMKYTLMHKNTAVVQIELDDVTGFISRIGVVYAEKHLPLGISVVRDRPDRADLNEWWTDRSIPASRSGIREALETLEISNTKMLLVRCLGLSLSDQYWIKPDGSEIIWESINFFDNPFSDDIGDVLFGGNKKTDALDFSSPDNTSDGNLKKRWKIMDGKRCLIKGGSNPFLQQPFNEVIAAGIMERLGIAHVPYSVIWHKDAPYSVCEDFVTAETELIPAWRILKMRKKPNNVSLYSHFLACAEELGIPGVQAFLDRMITVDYIIANEDRHFNNFGAIRNAETLEWLGMAPVYDSGSSLGYDKVASEIRSSRNVTCKPFKNDHEEQLKLVFDLSWFDPCKLSDVRELIKGTLSEGGASEYIDKSRITAIADSVERRIRNIADIAAEHTARNEDSTENDVEENIAEDYSNQKGQRF